MSPMSQSVYLRRLVVCLLLSGGLTSFCVAQDLSGPDWVHNNSFPHHWEIGEQTFLLRESTLDSLMTIEELRKLTTSNSRHSFTSQNTVKHVSFQEAIDENKEPSNDENESDIPGFMPFVIGATIYSSMELPQLQDELSRQKEIVSSDEQLGDAIKSSRLQLLASANEAILKINEYKGQRTTFKSEIEQLIDNEQRLRTGLNNVVEPEEPVVYESTFSQTLIDQIEEKRANLELFKQKLDRLEKDIQFHTERVTKIPAERAEANKALEDARTATARLIADSESADNKIAQILQELRYRAAEEELKKLDVEIDRQELSARIDPLERDSASRNVKRLETEIQSWEREIKKLRKKEVFQEQQLASQATETAHWSIKPLAERNEALVSERKKIVEELQLLRTEHQKIVQQTESIVERRSDITNKIAAAGLTATNGMLLVDLRRTLDSTGECHIRIHQLQTELRKVNLSKISLIQERDELDDPLGAVEKLVNSNDTSAPLVQRALQFIQTKREYLYQLIEDYQSYGRKVSEVSQARKKLIDEINSTLNYIDVNALWVRSAEPLSFKYVTEAGDGIDQFFDTESWTNIAAGSQILVTERPYEATTALFFLVALVIFNRRVKNSIERSESKDE